jgi:hypothetical protein
MRYGPVIDHRFDGRLPVKTLPAPGASLLVVAEDRQFGLLTASDPVSERPGGVTVRPG